MLTAESEREEEEERGEKGSLELTQDGSFRWGNGRKWSKLCKKHEKQHFLKLGKYIKNVNSTGL